MSWQIQLQVSGLECGQNSDGESAESNILFTKIYLDNSFGITLGYQAEVLVLLL